MGVGPRLDLTINPNTVNSFAFLWKDQNGVAIDYTGATFKLQVKARDTNDAPIGSVLLTLATGSGISGTVSDGEFNIDFPKYVLSPAAGLPVGSYVFDVLRLESAVAVEPVCWGLLDVVVGVTTE